MPTAAVQDATILTNGISLMKPGLFAVLLTAVGAFVSAHVAEAQLVPQKLEPHPLPAKVLEDLTKLGAESDVLVLGETHGTQETPAIASSLLVPLGKLGYGALALEIPAHEQQPLNDWATGKSETVPPFFAKPFDDGRANIQTLALIRTALSAPHRWRLICFDEPWDFHLDQTRNADKAKGEQELQSEDVVAAWVRRDAAMAAVLAKEKTDLGRGVKVLAICGGFHARTSRDRPADKSDRKAVDDLSDRFWPSFAGALASENADWRVRSVTIIPHGGAFFGSVSIDGGPPQSGIHPIRSNRKVDEAEAHALEGQSYDWELNLPRATPATFLVPPTETGTD